MKSIYGGTLHPQEKPTKIALFLAEAYNKGLRVNTKKVTISKFRTALPSRFDQLMIQ